MFCTYHVREKWINLHLTRTKMIIGSFYAHYVIHFTNRKP